MDDPSGRRRRGREHRLHRGYDHCPVRPQRPERGCHHCDVDKNCGCGGATEDGNRNGIHAYVLHSLLEEVCPVVEAMLHLVNWIDQNRTE